ncbi:unnamed protein product [marine sediment metagenome]|uniref:Uncharacterized protein n=1 Tax=marine sediment metagenome TaxID=412755 RepID=X0UP82_9ZZZZ
MSKSVALVRHRKPPSQTWRTFLDNFRGVLSSPFGNVSEAAGDAITRFTPCPRTVPAFYDKVTP